MPKEICEISISSWFYYEDICFDARSHERKQSGKLFGVYIRFLKGDFFLSLKFFGPALEHV